MLVFVSEFVFGTIFVSFWLPKCPPVGYPFRCQNRSKKLSKSELKKRFKVLDHISIYYLILGSYAPVCLITLYDYSGIGIFIAVLILSIIGTIKKLFFTGKYEFISVLLYLAMGWLIIFDINSLFRLIDSNAKLLLILGGVSYTFGVLFYAFSNIKYFHSIWHLFVLTGSILHYFMILIYII